MKQKTFWPYGILLSIIACVCACAYTIYVCLDYPVYVDNSQFASYQDVDVKINDIEDAKEAFERDFSVPKITLFADGKEVIEEMKMRKKRMVKTADSNSSFEILLACGAKNGSIEAFLTRPDTSIYDRTLQAGFSSDGVKILPFNVDKKGRWQVKVKIDSSDEKEKKIGIYSFEFFAR